MTEYISPQQVAEIIPGMTKGQLAQMRFVGTSGLRYYKPTPKTVLYKKDEVIAWVEASARYGTAAEAI